MIEHEAVRTLGLCHALGRRELKLDAGGRQVDRATLPRSEHEAVVKLGQCAALARGNGLWGGPSLQPVQGRNKPLRQGTLVLSLVNFFQQGLAELQAGGTFRGRGPGLAFIEFCDDGSFVFCKIGQAEALLGRKQVGQVSRQGLRSRGRAGCRTGRRTGR